MPYVGRGGLKMAGFIEGQGIDRGGSSTGPGRNGAGQDNLDDSEWLRLSPNHRAAQPPNLPTRLNFDDASSHAKQAQPEPAVAN